MQQWTQASPCADQSLGRAMSSTVTQGTPTVLQKKKTQHLQLRAIQRAPEKSVFLEKFQQSAVEVTPPRGGFAHVESVLHGEGTILGHAWFPQRSLQENSSRKTVGESELSPRQWGWLGNGCDFYSPKFDRLPRFVLFVFLRETFYGTQKYFANENKKATYRRLCEPSHRQMLLNTVFNWD